MPSVINRYTYIRISIALQELEPSRFRALINGHPVAADDREDLRLALTEVMVELAAKQGLAMVFLSTATATRNRV